MMQFHIHQNLSILFSLGYCCFAYKFESSCALLGFDSFKCIIIKVD